MSDTPTLSADGDAPGALPRGNARRVDALDALARPVVVGCMAIMIAVVSVQVLLRYAFNSSVDWADEIARLAFIWAIFLAIPLGIRHGAHVGIELFVSRIPPPLRRGLARLMALFAALLMAVVFYETWMVAAETWDEKLPTLDVTSSLFFVPVLVCAGHAFLHLVQKIWRIDAPATPLTTHAE